MTNLPVLSAERLSPSEVGRALREVGGFTLEPSIDADLCDAAVKVAHGFFAGPREEKLATAIERSPHFRGFSSMHNERDFREQIHLGRELPAAPEAEAERAPFLRLEGPNSWPSDPHFRETLGAYQRAVAELGEKLLVYAAADLGLPPDSFAGASRDGYLLLKLIAYHPQPAAREARPGVAAHVDFSWLTLTLQDAPGLHVLRPDGEWVEVEPRRGSLWVHAGELLQVASGGVYAAAPHRVVNPSLERTRVSLPLFLNPPLTATVRTLLPIAVPSAAARHEAEHVHRVIEPGSRIEPFHFGEAEWRRKGQNGWCYACSPPASEPALASENR